MSGQRGSSTIGSIAVGILAVITLVVVAVGVWHLGWFVKEKNTDKKVLIINHNTGTQTAWSDEVTKTISDFESTDPSNIAQRNALANKACSLIPRLEQPYTNTFIEAFEQEHCGS